MQFCFVYSVSGSATPLIIPPPLDILCVEVFVVVQPRNNSWVVWSSMYSLCRDGQLLVRIIGKVPSVAAVPENHKLRAKQESYGAKT